MTGEHLYDSDLAARLGPVQLVSHTPDGHPFRVWQMARGSPAESELIDPYRPLTALRIRTADDRAM